MLHKSFKPAKCKTALKLAVSRIKLLKNKRGAQVMQLKRELAQLLESGQDQTARIRVEHVAREEKTMAAYDLIEIYCELIAARLPIIESQKNCPIDLKEAITSVIFASPRCADIPELLDIRKHFTAKYGKEFSSSAIELRPDCGVNRMLVEKLSAIAPDGQTKIKMLSAIAEEHNIKWDPTLFGERDSKPPEDFLSGPNTFEKASKMHVEPSSAQAPPNRDQMHGASVNLYAHNTRSSASSQNVVSTDIDLNKMTPSATFHPEFRPLGTGTEGMEFRHVSSGENAFSVDRQSWNMEFKDATSAAQAAAESAERASMAARAAAELSARGKITRQYSAESQKSSAYGLRDEGPGKYAGSSLPDEHLAKDSQNNFFHGKNPGMQNEKTDWNGQDNLARVAQRFSSDGGSTKKSSQSASFKSNTAFIDDEVSVHGLQKPNEQLDYIAEARIRKQSSTVSSHSHSSTFVNDYDVHSNSNYQASKNDAGEDSSVGLNPGDFQTSTNQSKSSDNAAVVFDDSASDDDECRFDVEEDHSGRESNMHFQSPGRKSQAHFSENAWSPRQNRSVSLGNSSSQLHFFTESHNPSEFSESVVRSVVTSQSEDLLPVAFDDSDGQSSESEEEQDKSRFVGRMDTSVLPLKQSGFARNPEPTQSESHGFTGSSSEEMGNLVLDRKSWLHYSSVDSDSLEGHRKKNQGTFFDAESEKKFSFVDLSTSQSSPKCTEPQSDSNDVHRKPVDEGRRQKSLHSSRLSLMDEIKDKDAVHPPETSDIMQDNAFLDQTSFEEGKELNFGKLTGGLRNKGYGHPLYIRGSLNSASSSSKQTFKDTPTGIEQSTASPAARTSANSEAFNQEPDSREVSLKINEKMSSRAPVTDFDSDNDDSEAFNQEPDSRGVSLKINEKTNSRAPVADFDSDSDDSEEELSKQPSSSKQEPYSQKGTIEVNKKLSSRASITYFDSDSGDSEEDFPKRSVASKGRSGSGFSRRTKVSPSYLEKGSSSKVTVVPEASVTSGNGSARKPPLRSLYATETPLKPQFQDMSSGNWGSSERPKSVEQATYKQMPESKPSLHVESSKPTAKKQPSRPLPKIVTSGITEGSKKASGETSSGESAKKASHVHPKLPDYDTLSAHLQSLRLNRQ